MIYLAETFMPKYENIRVQLLVTSEGAEVTIITHNPQNLCECSTHKLNKMSVRRARALLRRYKISPRGMEVLFDQRWYRK